MKGMVFTEFLDFVGETFGGDMVDDIIEVSELPSGGAYTSVGTYSHGEMAALCGENFNGVAIFCVNRKNSN